MTVTQLTVLLHIFWGFYPTTHFSVFWVVSFIRARVSCITSTFCKHFHLQYLHQIKAHYNHGQMTLTVPGRLYRSQNSLCCSINSTDTVMWLSTSELYVFVVTEQASSVVTSLICIHEMSKSSLGWDTAYDDKICVVVLSYSRQMPKEVP